MKLILENWREYQLKEDLLSRSGYITGVLGVQLPLMEDGATIRPLTAELTEEIFREQQLLEQWWSGEDVLLEGPIGDWFAATKANLASYPETLQMLYRATKSEAKLHTFTKAIKRRGLGIKDQIVKFLNFIIEKAGSLQNAIMQQLAQWATKAKDAIEKTLQWIEGITKPWMKALGLVSLSVGMQFAWSKIAEHAKEFFGCGGEEEEDEDEDGTPDHEEGGTAEVAGGIAKDCFISLATKFLKDQAKALFGDALKSLAEEGAGMITGGVTTFWNWLKKIAKGVKFVVAALESTLDHFKRRGGLAESLKEGISDDYLENWRRHLA